MASIDLPSSEEGPNEPTSMLDTSDIEAASAAEVVQEVSANVIE